ncbi:PspC domain-containing protein [Kiritimatiellaeota bacterium B1221]|nr:PspC domain-containing protein [Kiritimatiellaeota bacterium B1221]
MKKCPFCAEDIADAALKCKHCGEFLNTDSKLPPPPPSKKFTRSRDDRVLSGVCGGLAAYADMDPNIMRLLVFMVVFFTGIVPGIIAYILLAMLIPEA